MIGYQAASQQGGDLQTAQFRNHFEDGVCRAAEAYSSVALNDLDTSWKKKLHGRAKASNHPSSGAAERESNVGWKRRAALQAITCSAVLDDDPPLAAEITGRSLNNLHCRMGYSFGYHHAATALFRSWHTSIVECTLTNPNNIALRETSCFGSNDVFAIGSQLAFNIISVRVDGHNSESPNIR